MTLNEITKECYDIALKRAHNNGSVNVDTNHMLKHTATEVVEAMEAYTKMNMLGNFAHIEAELENAKQDFSLELADILVCVMIIAEKENINLDEALRKCINKNRDRANGVGDKL